MEGLLFNAGFNQREEVFPSAQRFCEKFLLRENFQSPRTPTFDCMQAFHERQRSLQPRTTIASRHKIQRIRANKEVGKKRIQLQWPRFRKLPEQIIA
jgi:hypothetical protein